MINENQKFHRITIVNLKHASNTFFESILLIFIQNSYEKQLRNSIKFRILQISEHCKNKIYANPRNETRFDLRFHLFQYLKCSSLFFRLCAVGIIKMTR
jgi:hypothetical protein